MASEFWLDIGAGIDAEHWAATPAPPGVRRIAMDPLFTSRMIQSGRLAPLPLDILRVGAEVRPEFSVEAGRERSFLPFRGGSIARVHCGFVLHLYLETLDLLTEEAMRVLRPGGEFEALLPYFGDGPSEQIFRHTHDTLCRVFGNARLERHLGPFTTFWEDLYSQRTFRFHCWKNAEPAPKELLTVGDAHVDRPPDFAQARQDTQDGEHQAGGVHAPVR